MTDNGNPFKPATVEQSKLRQLIFGPSGCGKTWTALEIATKLAAREDGKVAVVDSEGRTARKYARHFSFDLLELSSYAPDAYVQAIQAAVKYGYKVIVIDSGTHAWNGQGGVLEIVDKAGAKMRDNKWAGWSEGRPAHNSFINAIIAADIHVIITLRSKTEWVLETDERGKNKPRKVGMTYVQSDEFEYEFDVVMMQDMSHTLHVTKSRCQEIPAETEWSDCDDLTGRLHAWLTDGEPPAPWYEDEYKMSVFDRELNKAGLTRPKALELLKLDNWTGFPTAREALAAARAAARTQKPPTPAAPPASNGDTPPKPKYDLAAVKEATKALYDNMFHHERSIQKLIAAHGTPDKDVPAEHAIQPNDATDTAIARALLHRAWVDYGFNAVQIVEALNAMNPDDPVKSYGEWHKKGRTLEAAWKAVREYALLVKQPPAEPKGKKGAKKGAPPAETPPEAAAEATTPPAEPQAEAEPEVAGEPEVDFSIPF